MAPSLRASAFCRGTNIVSVCQYAECWEPESCPGQVFNFKLGSFTQQRKCIRPFLKLKPQLYRAIIEHVVSNKSSITEDTKAKHRNITTIYKDN
jgi:hypothetical protein